jgi:hypothetical protein
VRVAFGEPLARSLRRRLKAARPWRIAELREGLHGRVCGTVRPFDGATLQAPLTGRPCVYFHLEVIQIGSIGDGFGQHLVTLDKRGVQFLLVDDGHHALIDPTYAELLVSAVHVTKASSIYVLDDQQRALLDRLGLLGDVSRRPGVLRFSEAVVELGGEIAVAGTASHEVDPEAMAERGYRERLQTRLRFAGAPKLPLLIGDVPR